MTLQNTKRLKERWDNSLVEKINERLRAIIFNGANLTRSNLSELVPFPETPAGRIDLRGFFFFGGVQGVQWDRVDFSHGEFGVRVNERGVFGSCLGCPSSRFLDCLFDDTKLKSHIGGIYEDCSFVRARFPNVLWNPGSTFLRCSFQSASLTGGTGVRMNFQECSFKGCNLKGANMAELHFKYCDFAEAKLGNAGFADSVFVHCKISPEQLTTTMLEGARWLDHEPPPGPGERA